jgi:hypothetical protein
VPSTVGTAVPFLLDLESPGQQANALDSSHSKYSPPMVWSGSADRNSTETNVSTKPIAAPPHGAGGTELLAEVSWCKSESSASAWSTCSSSNSFARVERAVRDRSPLEQLKGLVCNAQPMCNARPSLTSLLPLEDVEDAAVEAPTVARLRETAAWPLATKCRGVLPRNMEAYGIRVKVTADVSAADQAHIGSAGSVLRGWSNRSDSHSCLAERMTAIAVAPISDLTASPFAAAAGKRYVHAKGAAGGRKGARCVWG